MAERTLIDTSAWIEALRPDGDQSVRDEVAELTVEGRAVLCDMVLLELWNGARGDAERQLPRDLQKELDLLETDRAVWDLAAELARNARDAGRTVPAADILIAACAIRHDAALVHTDRHFSLIAGI